MTGADLPWKGREPLVSIAIPVYNERDRIEEAVRRVQAAPVGHKEIIVVDDASTDGTRDILDRLAEEQPALRVEFFERNRGKGAAVRRAFELAAGDVVVIHDADLEYDPADWPALLAPILAGRADVVYGSRFTGGEHRVLFFWHRVGNSFITFFSNVFTNLNLTDMETGQKAFRADVLAPLHLVSNRFGIEVELTARLARARARFYEVPIRYHGRSYEAGKKITWRDGLAAVWWVLRFNLFG